MIRPYEDPMPLRVRSGQALNEAEGACVHGEE